MLGRFIIFVLALLVALTFIGFNIGHSSDIKYWFGEDDVLKDVSILVSFFVIYILGVLSALPFIIHVISNRRIKENRKLHKTNSDQTSKKSHILNKIKTKTKSRKTANDEETMEASEVKKEETESLNSDV